MKIPQAILDKLFALALIPPLFASALPQVKPHDAIAVAPEGAAPLMSRQLPQPQDLQYRVTKTIRLTVTAYSSTVDQTDGDPFTAASGAKVHDGMVAHNGLPFGTKVRFPDQFGDKIFVIEDRMNARKGFYVADIWMPTRQAAIQWGAPVVKMEILEN